MLQTVHERLGSGFRVSGFGFWAVEQIMLQTVHERLGLGFRVSGVGF